MLNWILIAQTICLYSLSSGAKEITYADLPKLVRERNEKVQSARNSLSSENAKTGYLGRSFLPNVTGRAGHESFKQESQPIGRDKFWLVEGRLNLYRGGRDRLEEEVRSAQVRSVKAGLDGEYAEQLKLARQTYWRLAAVSYMIKDKKAELDQNERFIYSSRRRAGAGVSTAADTVQFEMHKTSLEQNLKKMVLEQDFLRNRLAVTIAWDKHENMQIVDKFEHPPDDGGVFPTIAANDTVSVRALSEKQKIEHLKATQSSRWWVPRLDLFSHFGLPPLSDESSGIPHGQAEWSLGLQIGVDLSSGMEGQALSNAHDYAEKSLQLRTAHRLREITAMDHELRHDLKLLHELIHDADQNINQAENFLRLTQLEHTRGVKNGPDLLVALQKLYESRERRTMLYRDFYGTQAELIALLETDK